MKNVTYEDLKELLSQGAIDQISALEIARKIRYEEFDD